jgi:type I restriction enzyme M protein
MLDNITKKNIDNCRDVLVGKVPDPKSQIEQITLALIYKFMDDMDKESIDLGGMPKFFTGDYEKFGWRKLFDPSLGGKEVLDLYSEALDVLQTNANLPELFRNIFKNAYLPYRDPSTLKMFLKYINEFEYSHSEKLGDAFEYLLSVMGSQGDAGQFRTPRHVIDFIAACLNPQKHETVADPACGTAGFLLSAYKHILQNNTDKRLGDKLTPDDRKKLAENFYGYDISPDMVRLSLVNMYLHGFTTPKIFEYDTLSSEDRWNETFDVILANPPFMTPKGGIRPHKKFGVQANKAEVLFTDYIAEHLSKNGRAGIVVPNGIVATTQTAYKQLRKMLVDDSLIAVVSLPAGCFNPYSGVKTSILMLDKPLAKKTNHVLFIKVSNDGYDLGAQRREHDKNDLPLALEAFNAYKESFSSGKPFDTEKYSSICTLVEKEKIATNKDIVLSGERYVEGKVSKTEFELVKIGNFFDIFNGFAFDSNNISNSINSDSVPIIKIGNVIHGEDVILNKEFVSKSLHKDKKGAIFNGKYHDIFIALSGATTGKISKLSNEYIEKEYALNQRVAMLRSKSENALSKYLYYILLYGGIYEVLLNLAHGAAQPNLSSKQISELEIPLPPIEIQEQIVKEIEGYQKIIDGAKIVVDNYKPTINIKPDWEMVELETLCDKITDGSHFSPNTVSVGYPYVTVRDLDNCKIDIIDCKKIDKKAYLELVKSGCKPQKNDVLFSKDGTVGKVALVDFDADFVVLSSLAIIRPTLKKITSSFLSFILQSDFALTQAINLKGGVAIKRVVLKDLKTIKIPNISINEQQEITTRIESEQQLVSANKQLISIFEQKIKDKINEVWGVKEEA